MNEQLEYKTFWMIWNPSGRAPTFKHHSEGAAIEEAERLARENRGQTFVVLEATAARRTDDMLRLRLSRDADIPF